MISLKTKIRIMEAREKTVVKYGFKAWVLQKPNENLLDIFQRNSLRIVLGTWQTDRLYTEAFNKERQAEKLFVSLPNYYVFPGVHEEGKEMRNSVNNVKIIVY